MIYLFALLAATPLLEKYECARCHETLAEVAVEKSCVRCHQQIFSGEFRAAPDVLAEWRTRIHSLNATPALEAVKRFQKRWVKSFLLAPKDLRPSLEATMPRLAISEEEAAQIAELLGAREDRAHPSYAAAEIARGKQLYAELACAACHEGQVAPLAPHLSVARERLSPELVRSIVRDPTATMPNARMPAYELSEDEARAIEAFVIAGELSPPPRVEYKPRLKILERRVGFDEVYEKVFRKTCWHCHSDAQLARGDGGPGNTGGFGFPAKGLSFADYPGVNSGSIGANGNRRSIFRPENSGEENILVERLIARQLEEAGEFPKVRGMPLGLPALSPEQLQLVESWIAQGRPR